MKRRCCKECGAKFIVQGARIYCSPECQKTRRKRELQSRRRDPKTLEERLKRAEASWGEILRKERKQAGLTQEELAKAVGISRPAIGNYERDICIPSPKRQERLSIALGVLLPYAPKNYLARLALAKPSRRSLGTCVKLARLQLGMTQKELGRRVGICADTISLIELGKRVPSTMSALFLGEVLCIDIRREVANRQRFRTIRIQSRKYKGKATTPGEELRKLRFQKIITRKGLASQIGVDPNTISEWESSQKTPTPKSLRKLSRALGPKIFDIWFSSPGEKLSNFRREKRQWIPYLARRIGVTPKRYKAWEANEEVPTPEEREKLVTILPDVEGIWTEHD